MDTQHNNSNTQTLLSIDRRVLSHELCTALTVILGNAELLKQENLTSEQAAFIDDLQMSGEHLLEFVRKILNEAKPVQISKQCQL